MKYLILIITALVLTACTPSVEETTENWKLNKDLSDCKVYFLHNGSIKSLTVVRCPNSATATKMQGKTPKFATVIEE